MSALARAALSTLTTWQPPSSEQAALREAYLAVLHTSTEVLWRRHAAGHLTAGALVLDADARHVLLVAHPRAGMWLPPGGHLEAEDTSLAAAAEREVREETGLTTTVDPVPLVLDAHPFTCSLGVPTRHLNVGFLARAARANDGGLPIPVRSAESEAVRWWPVAALPTRAPQRLVQEVAAALDRLSG